MLSFMRGHDLCPKIRQETVEILRKEAGEDKEEEEEEEKEKGEEEGEEEGEKGEEPKISAELD